jgi:acylphosphatase
MATVKGSKQYQMVVTPHRPFYRGVVFLLCLIALTALSWLTFKYGLDQGMATKGQVVNERDELRSQLDTSVGLVGGLRQHIADIKLGGQVDVRANEEIQVTVEALQKEIAELSEEIRFYKGVMVPNAEERGLRIERLDMKQSSEPSKFRYSLLLAQIVDKHDYVNGGFEINVLGKLDGEDRSLSLIDLGEGAQEAIRFRFRYFQNIDGELSIPEGFSPKEIMIVAQSSGRGSQRIEKRFDWQLIGG